MQRVCGWPISAYLILCQAQVPALPACHCSGTDQGMIFATRRMSVTRWFVNSEFGSCTASVLGQCSMTWRLCCRCEFCPVHAACLLCKPLVLTLGGGASRPCPIRGIPCNSKSPLILSMHIMTLKVFMKLLHVYASCSCRAKAQPEALVLAQSCTAVQALATSNRGQPAHPSHLPPLMSIQAEASQHLPALLTHVAKHVSANSTRRNSRRVMTYTQNLPC